MLHKAVIIAAGLGLGLTAAAQAAPTNAQKCEAAKLKASGKYHFCRLLAERKAVLQGGAPDYSKCDTTLTAKWSKAETTFGIACPTIGDQSQIQATATGDSGGIASRLSPLPAASFSHTFPASGQTTCWTYDGSVTPCAGTGNDGGVLAGAALDYVDNLDGTVTDMNTGLMWEKKSDDGSAHDKDNTYPWVQLCTGDFSTQCQTNADCVVPGGTCTAFGDGQGGNDTIFDWVAQLNAGPGFAGHTDWRVPNVKELQSIINYEIPYPGPTVAAAFNTGCVPTCTVTSCSCTQSYVYWSSTTYADLPDLAWYVSFDNGLGGALTKDDTFHVRAVRGGL